MTDVFISYSRTVRDEVVPIADALRNLGLDVWFDVELRPGDFVSERILEYLRSSRCVLVLWTRDAVDKGPRGWVWSEADWAHQHGKLIQAQIDAVRLPPPFFSSLSPPIDLTSVRRSGKLSAIAWNQLLKAVGAFAKRPGLSHLSDAENSETKLLSWAARFPDDPLVTAVNGDHFPIAAKIRQARESAVKRIQKRANLASELRGLVADTARAPTSLFESPQAVRQSYPTAPRVSDGMAGELWPRSSSALAALGLDVNVYGLEFYDLLVERAFDGPTPILLVSGEIRNIGRDEKRVPPVRVSLRDADQYEVAEVVQVVADGSIDAGASLPFQIRIENPPADATELEATFAKALAPPLTAQPTLELTTPLGPLSGDDEDDQV